MNYESSLIDGSFALSYTSVHRVEDTNFALCITSIGARRTGFMSFYGIARPRAA